MVKAGFTVKEGSTLTKGRAALLTAWREKPTELVKAIFGILPRELVLDHVASELDDTELNAMIEAFREQQRPHRGCRGVAGAGEIPRARSTAYSPRFNMSGSLAMFDATRLASSIVICFASKASASVERP